MPRRDPNGALKGDDVSICINSVGARVFLGPLGLRGWFSLPLNRSLESGHSERRIKSAATLWVPFLLMLMILLYVVSLWNGVATTGICLQFSLSTIDQPGGYALSAGVSPCRSQSVEQSID